MGPKHSLCTAAHFPSKEIGEKDVCVTLSLILFPINWCYSDKTERCNAQLALVPSKTI